MLCRIPPDGVKPSDVVLYRDKAKWGKSVKLITFSVFLVLLIVALSLSAVIVIFICLGILLIPYLFAPKSFELTQSGIVVRRLLRSFEIPYSKVKGVSVIDLPLGIRLWASGGLYGYYGLFYLDKLGKVWVYATRRKRVLLLKVNNNKYIISPENLEVFLKLLENFIG